MKELSSQRLDQVHNAISILGEQMSLPLLLTMIFIARHEGLSIKDLTEKAGLTQQTASRYVGILQGRYEAPGLPSVLSKGPLISLTVSADDPRSRALYLTDYGRELLSRFLERLYVGNRGKEK